MTPALAEACAAAERAEERQRAHELALAQLRHETIRVLIREPILAAALGLFTGSGLGALVAGLALR